MTLPGKKFQFLNVFFFTMHGLKNGWGEKKRSENEQM